MAEWLIEPLDRSHEREAFTCGKDSLDRFLRSLVAQYERRRLGRTYVATREGDKRILGYYTLASSAVAFEELPSLAAKKLPRHPVPVVLLARLAVDTSARGQGLGRRLIADAMQRCLALSERLGIHAIEVEAIDDEATAFYRHYGFVSLVDDPRHLYLPLVTIQNALARRA